jgi:hypothetical protein
MMLPTSFVVHEMPGRTRMRISAQRKNERFFAQTHESLKKCEGVSKVETNPLTGSILILHSSSIEEIKEFAERESLFVIQTANNPAANDHEARPFFEQISTALKSFDIRVSEMTNGQLDGKEVAISGLLLAAAYQIVKGSLWPAAGTLVWYALSLLPEPGSNDDRARE